MQIEIKAGRDVMNQWVDVTVTSSSPQLIAHVTTKLDEIAIGDDDLNPPEDSYERTWHQVGTGIPGQTHKAVVVASDQNGNVESASKTWQDQGGPVTGP
jgi:hypothetical protein